MSECRRQKASVLGAEIDAVEWNCAVDTVRRWARSRESRYICICNVHSAVTASLDPEFRMVVNEADMATPDGMPVAWVLRRLGFVGQQRINGPDLMWKLCEAFAQSDADCVGGNPLTSNDAREGWGKGDVRPIPVYFYGSRAETLRVLREQLLLAFPGLCIGGMVSPPFRMLSDSEDAADVAAINDSRAGVVFVSLGCPKQENWMATHRGRVKAVMIGVGAAFDYHAGTIKRAPRWMQDRGLEWFYRLIMEPRRLWKRYLVTNVLFVLGMTRQFLSPKG